MKKLIFLVLAFAAIMVSCSSNADLAGVASVSSSTSASVAAYVAENYPATKIVSTTASGSTVTATLNTGETLSFSKAGSFMAYSNNSGEGLETDSLIVSDSIRMDSIGRPHHRGGHRHGGPEGPGQGGMMGGGHGEGPEADSMHVGHPRHFENEIAVDSLPTVINDYILANYAGNTVIHAEKDTLCQGAVIEVLVCVTTQEPIKLVFDAAGAYLFKAERIHYTSVSAEVSAAVTANYSTFKVKNRAEEFTLVGGALQYKVFIQSKDVRKSVTLNADGTVSCEK
jgi:hypothetical protein